MLYLKAGEVPKFLKNSLFLGFGSSLFSCKTALAPSGCWIQAQHPKKSVQGRAASSHDAVPGQIKARASLPENFLHTKYDENPENFKILPNGGSQINSRCFTRELRWGSRDSPAVLILAFNTSSPMLPKNSLLGVRCSWVRG